MTLNEKIKDSVQMTTGLRCFEGTPPDSVTGRFAYFFPLRSGVAKRYNEVAVFFVERPVFAPLDPERATVDCRYLALDWLNGLYAYSGLKFQEIISQNNIRDGFGGYGVGLRLVLVDEARHTGGAEPEPKLKYFTFTALQDNSSVGWTGTYPNLEYSTDGSTWTAFTEPVSVNTGDKVMFRNNGTTWVASGDSSHFTTTGIFNLSGNIMSLVDPTLESTTIPSNYCFYCLFYRCNGIVSAVDLELPATTLRMACYAGMFLNCTSLTTAPSILSATRLSGYCYQSMFNGCSSLTTAPELPATTLSQNCYQNMFYGCTALTSAPELPATTLAQNCYASMFAECSSLETAPVLPATTLADGCYSYMFRACTSLETAPELPATTLLLNCYNSMFIGCTSLEHIKVNFTEWVSTATDYWVENVAASGTFECPDGLSIVYDKDHIPTGWRVVKPTMYNVLAVSGDQTMGSVTGGGSYAVGDTVTLTATALDGYNFVNWTVNNVEVSTSESYTFTVSQAVTVQGNFEEAASYLTFTALQDGSNIGWNGTYPNLEYSKNGGTWTAFTEQLTGLNTGDYVEFRNNGTAWTEPSNTRFTTSKKFNLSGNIMSLVDKTMQSTTIPMNNCFKQLFLNCKIASAADLELPATTLTDNCYEGMFWNCGDLTTAPRVLPATTLAPYCYQGMFYGCSYLTTPPVISATTLATYCCYQMFQNCTRLVVAPELPATTLASFCYYSMFNGCTSLTTAPELPATTLYSSCYNQMFYGCTHLTTAPTLPATTLAQSCYSQMFYNCGSLTTAPELPATTIANWCYMQMFRNCSSLTTAPELPATTLYESCYNGMFENCTSLTTAPELPATTSAKTCYATMFKGCTSLTTAPTRLFSSMYWLGNSCCYGMFKNCTSLTTAPEIPATGTVRECYGEMFSGCSSLNYIKCLATNISAVNCTYQWTSGVSATGTFVKDASMSSWTTGVDGIPDGWTVIDAQ